MRTDPDGMDETVEARLRTLGPAGQTLAANGHTTIEPTPHGVSDTGGQRALAALASLRASIPGSPADGLRLEDTLGEGGMGVVRLGEQVALGRKVAVKTLRAGKHDDRAKLRLLREAWVTGALEHPNIVPVHDVTLDAEGQPVIVLKRIEGVEWTALMHDAAQVAERFGGIDLLEWNLQILMQVCNAVHFAHSRGFVHRDLKPDNVMIGAFGEVYVLDWGIAVRLEDDGSGRFALASQATEMAGTPCYMAPEMLGGREPTLSPRTDVYLLGAVLYEILAGDPPHVGDSPAELVRSILASPAPLPEGAPEELARICRRAMAADPADRFGSAEDLRAALQDFMRHQGSARLASEATRRLKELGQCVTEPLPEGDEDAREARTLRAYDLFGECRFGFQQALGTWPDNARAQKGLRRAYETMVRFEVRHGDAKTAARLLAEMNAPPPDLAERVQRVKEKDDKRRQELEALDRALDPATGRRTRTAVAGFLGVLWTLSPLLAGLSFPDAVNGPLQLKAATVGYLVIVLGLGLWARESLSRTLINRRIYATVLFFLVAQFALVAMSESMNLEAATIRALSIFLWSAVAGMMAIYLNAAFAAVALGYLAAFVAVVRWPEHYFLITAAANLNLTVFVVFLFWNLPRESLRPPLLRRRAR
jgi:eukaryotic-like serine/threonine-protein kinase